MQRIDDVQAAMDPHDTESGSQSVGAGPVDLCELRDLYDSLMKGECTTEDILSAPVLDSVRDIMNVARQSMKDLRTAQLWLQYMDMIDILRTFIRSERTGDWRRHMNALHDMLPYLAAAGHNLYAKSIYVYLQRLAQLSIQHPEVHHQFQNGYHVVRRSDRHWAGLSTDFLIEQVLMRSVKTTGGLTRGRGMSEPQRITWMLSTPICAEVNIALQDYTSVQYGTSDQHKEQRAARQARDTDDTHELIGYLSLKDPFGNDPTLQSRHHTGITAGDSVNADQAASVGMKILDGMVGKKVLDHTFKKKNQVVTLDTRSSVKKGKDSVLIHNCCFNTIDILLEADKPALAEAIWKQLPIAIRNTVLPQNVQYLLDGRALLHRIPWTSGETYEGISSHYMRYVRDRYGNAVTVFDGYVSAPSTKDVAHSRHVRSHSSPLLKFTKDMVCNMKKDDFLANQTNKKRFINLLSDDLQRQHNDVLHARAVADVLIVETAIAWTNTKDTVVVGDDTDLLVLLCSRTGPTSHNLFFRPEPKLTSRRQAKCWNIEQVQKILGRHVCNNLLVAHGLLGCNTTSRLYSIGKSAALKKLNSSAYFSGLLETFNTTGASKEDVMTAGENALVCLYNGQPGETLNKLRLQRFCQKVSPSTVRVEPRTLPPTSASAKQHCLRVYVQVQQWKGVGMDANGWEWAIRDERMVPVMKPAPDYLLDAIHCSCNTDCSTRRCSCRKHNLECSSACSECKGLHCSNVTLPEPESDPEEEYALAGPEDKYTFNIKILAKAEEKIAIRPKRITDEQSYGMYISNDIGKDLLMGTVYGNRGRDNKTRYSDNIKEIGGGRSFVALSSPNLTGINGSTHGKVKRAGETFVLKLYGASSFESLDKYRHIAYKRAIGRCSPSSSFQLASLPPTSAAAKKHSYRNYHTVQEWMGNTLPPIEWGWRSHDETLVPVETDRPVAPESLLNMVSCS
ncbi:hypothetical protein GQR58_002605 [Nymphon striatum]|nr:hypothetical protein GQR58_002605 [Nymphon striatum]